MPKISVIIPIYNVEKYLKECLDSLLNQNFGDIEILCINDGSTDDTLSILQEYSKKDSRIKILNQENRGQSDARNKGLEIAKGDYIAFVDADDFISADYFEKLYNTAEDNQADIAVGNVIYYDKGKYIKDNYIAKQSFKAGFKPITTFKRKLKLFKSVVVWNKIYKRELVTDIRFPLNLKFEDNYFTYGAIFSAKKIVLVPSVNYYYRSNPESTMNTIFNSERIYDIFRVVEEMEHLSESGYFLNKQEADCKYVLVEYKINMLYSWLKLINKKFKPEFLKKVKEVYSKLNIFDNPYIDEKTKKRYNRVLGVKQTFFAKLKFFISF